MSADWRPLEGVRVLDLSRLLPGPFLTQLFTDLGADVIKLEEPGTGDYARWAPPEVDGAGHWFAAVNRGKRSIAVNLKSAEGRAIVERLARESDIFVEGFRPGVLDRLGLGDAHLATLKPDLIRLSLVGYAEGEYRREPGHDINYEALAGILGMQGTAAQPALSAVPIADLAGAMYGAVAVLAALHERSRTGTGRRIEIALADAAFGFNSIHLARGAADDPPARGEWELGGAMPGYRAYECGDGAFVALGALEPRFWDAFIDAVGRAELAPIHMDASPEAHAQMEALFLERPAQEWLDALIPAGVPVTPILSPKEALDHPYASRYAGRVGPGSPLTGRPHNGPIPSLGEHTDAILKEAGLNDDDVLQLRAGRIVE